MSKNKLLLLLVLLAAVATGAWAQTQWTSGDCTVTLSNGTLTVSGKGAMADYDNFADRSWNNNINDITSVVVESGVTTVGKNAFYACTGLTSVTLPEGLTKIGVKAFRNCNHLTSITIPSTVTSIGSDAFFACSAMTDVYLYPDPANLAWDDGDCDDFKANKATQCHVLAEHLSAYQTKLNSVNVTVVGDLKPLPATYSITLDEGTGNKDSQNWEITPQSSELSGGEDVTVKYNGSREVKSVTVVKKAEKAVDNTYQTWNRKQKKLVATDIPAEATTVANADDGATWEAGTYVVEGDVTIGGKITLNGAVELIIKDGATLTAQKIVGDNNKLYIYGQSSQTGQLVVNCSNGDPIRELSTLEVHSAKVTATSSINASGGIGEIGEFNVYGGSVEAKGTVATSYGIALPMGSSMNIYGGEVKAEGTGDGDVWGYGIVNDMYKFPATVTVYGGKLWAGNANNKALNSGINLQKGEGFTGKIETSDDGSSWDELLPGAVPNSSKYVRVGY